MLSRLLGTFRDFWEYLSCQQKQLNVKERFSAEKQKEKRKPELHTNMKVV